tara:strand:+ start:119 stop:1138 length:1020 start_codon:yes stop_codon:yes gene_type:complete
MPNISLIIISILISLNATAANFNLDTGNAATSPKYNKTLINAIDVADERIIGVGIHGIIIYSDDNGENWHQANVPTTLTLTDIDCVTEYLCWATGHDALILKSQDKGENWIKQFEDAIFDAPLLSISMYDSMSGIAVGAFAKALGTVDGGNTWNEFYITQDEFQPHINTIIVDENYAYAAGELGNFYVSADKGKNWKLFDTGYTGSIWASSILSSNTLLLLGMSGNIILTNSTSADNYDFKIYNNGIKNTLTSGKILTNGNIAVSGLGGVISIVDLNNKKNISTCVRQDRLGNTGIIELSNNKLLVAGEKGLRVHDMQECYLTSLDTVSVNTWISKSIN